MRERVLPRPVQQRRRHGGVPADDGPRLREAGPVTNPADVAALADAGITAYHAVRKALPLLHPGTTAVVQGAGGLGHIGIQCLAALTAARIVVVDKNPDALELAAQIGADETVPADGNHVAAVQDLTGGGAHGRLRLRRRAGRGDGRLEHDRAGRLVLRHRLRRRAAHPDAGHHRHRTNIVGNIVGTYTDLAELMVLAQAGKVTLHTQQYPLDGAVDALHDLDAGKVRGRAILVP